MCSNFIYQTDLWITLPVEEALGTLVLCTETLGMIPLISFAIFFFLERLNIQKFASRSEFSAELGMYQTKIHSKIVC